MGCSFETAKERTQCGNSINNNNNNSKITKNNNNNKNITRISTKDETKTNSITINTQQIISPRSISEYDDGIIFQNKDNNKDNNQQSDLSKRHTTSRVRGLELERRETTQITTTATPNKQLVKDLKKKQEQPQEESEPEATGDETEVAEADEEELEDEKEEEEEKNDDKVSESCSEPESDEGWDGGDGKDKKIIDRRHSSYCQQLTSLQRRATTTTSTCHNNKNSKNNSNNNRNNNSNINSINNNINCCHLINSSWRQSFQTQPKGEQRDQQKQIQGDQRQKQGDENQILGDQRQKQGDEKHKQGDPKQKMLDQRQKQGDRKQVQVDQKQKQRHPNYVETRSSYTRAACKMAAAIRGSGQQLPEMLLYARDYLATYLTQAANVFIAAAATTTTCSLKKQTQEAKKKMMKLKQQRQRKQWSNCWHRTVQQQWEQQKTRCKHCQQQEKIYSSNNNDHCELSNCRPCSCGYNYNNNSNHYSNNSNSYSKNININRNSINSNNTIISNKTNSKTNNSNNTNSININSNNTTSNNNSYNNSNNYYNYNTLRNSISLYAASSVLLVLCCLTTTTSAAATNSNTATLEKHPIQGIDWSKFDESSSDKEILDLLLEKKRYDKRLLPPVNDEDFCCGLSSPDMAKDSKTTMRSHNRGTLTVNVNVLLLSLASPDESSLKYEVEFLLNQQWNDPRLQYGNKSQYDYLNALHHHDNIWTPDTYFIMHGDFKDPIIPMHFALRIYRNGTITYAMRRHLILSCQGSLHIFPFDDPKCSFSMESISYEEAQIKYVWKNDEDTLRKSPSLTTLNAYLIKNQTTACDQNSWRGNYSCLRVDLIFTRDRAFYFTTVFIPGIILVTSSFITFWLEWNAVPARSMIGNYSCLQVELTFTRDRAYYFTTVFIPGIILVTSSFITFWLEWNAVPARVMIGVTTMLNFFTTSNGFRSTLPVVSNLTAMNVWDGVCMCFIYASLLEFVCVNYVGRKRPLHNVVYRPGENPVTQRLPAVLSRIGVILASPLEIIDREFHAALSSEKAAAGISSPGGGVIFPSMPPMSMATPTRTTTSSPTTTTTQPPSSAPPPPPPTTTAMTPTMVAMEQQHGSIIGAAVQNLRARSIKYRKSQSKDEPAVGGPQDPIYTEPVFEPSTRPEFEAPTTSADDTKATTTLTMTTAKNTLTTTGGATTTTTSTTVTLEDDNDDDDDDQNRDNLEIRHSHSVFTNTPALIQRPQVDQDFERMERQQPIKPPRKKTSRSTSPAGVYFMEMPLGSGDEGRREVNGFGRARLRSTGGGGDMANGEKRRETSAPNEIVACTSCGGGNSPCTHSANNGCATETCFVQVRKKEPPHPIRVAKTIDVIARITFPTAYSIFLIFFFVHYKGFS